MLRLRAFRGTTDKIVKIAVHPTHPWLVTADASDYVSVWNWEHRQIIYELKAGGVDRRRLVGAKLEKLAEGDASKAKPVEAIRGGSVKQVKFFDDDVRFWQHWRDGYAAAEAPFAANQSNSAFRASSIKGQHFLVICCENKAIFLDLVTMRGRDVPKQELDNKSLLCMEFLPWLSFGDSPLVAFGGSDGVIRVLSMMTWKLASRSMGGHKGSISCLMTFMASSGVVYLVSGGSDGLLVIWNAHHGHGSRELIVKLIMKAHDGGVVGVELSRVIGGSPQLITIGADKTLAIWDTNNFKEIRRIKPVPKLACHSVASWCHPRAPNLDILTCVKDSYIWAIESPMYSAVTRPLCDLYSLVPPLLVATNKKLRVYCMVAHPLQPHLVATGTNVGVIVSEFDPGSLPPVIALPTSAESRDHSAVCIYKKEIKLLNFQLSNATNPSIGNNSSLSETGKLKGDSLDALHVTQTKKRINAPVPHDSYSVLSVSSSGKYIAVVWPDNPYFSIYKVSDWSIVDSGSARLLAWDASCDRFAILESKLPPRVTIIPKGSSSRKAKEAAAAAAQAAAAAAAANSASANVQVRILLDDGTSNILMGSIGSRTEPVTGLYGGALFGVAYRTSRRVTPGSATTLSTIQSTLLSGFGSSGSFGTFDNRFSSQRSHAESVHRNFQFFSWETFQPVGSLLPQPEWTAWDQTVEYCALAYKHYIVICTLRPQYRYLGDVAISYATGAVWQRRQLFVATPTTIECVFVDAGVAAIDIETRKRKEEIKLKEAQARAVADHGELALITVDGPQTTKEERTTLRTPMLQVVRLASFVNAPSVPSFLSLPKHLKVDGDDMEEIKVNEIAVGGGGVTVAVTRFPTEKKRPVGPLVVVGVRDGVLWLIDRYMTVHALPLSHPGIRCRCLAAYGDAVSAVKWAIQLAREHHDDLAQFLLGMGYATEALHLPGISKRLEFDLAMKSNDLKRALQCLLTMSNSRDIGQDNPGLQMTEILHLTAKKENLVEAVQGIVKFAKEFLDLIDAADATAQGDIAREALKRLATAGSVKGALPSHELRGLALRLANHGELTRLSGLANNLISLGLGREAAFAAALLGDNAHMEKAWQDTGMLAEAVLHAHAHGRSTLKNLVEAWNKVLQKEVDRTPTEKTDATAAFLASLEEPKLSSLSEAGKKPPIEIFPPGMSALSSSIVIKKTPASAAQTSQQQANKPLAIEGPQPTGPIGAPIGPSASAATPGPPIGAPPPGAPAAIPATPIEAPAPGAPGAPAARTETPIGEKTAAPHPGAAFETAGTPSGEQAATPGMPMEAPSFGASAATPATLTGASLPGAATETPNTTLGAPSPGTPAATPGTTMGTPPPGTLVAEPDTEKEAPPPGGPGAKPGMPIGASSPGTPAATPGTSIEAPVPDASFATSGTPTGAPPLDAPDSTPSKPKGSPPPASTPYTGTRAPPPSAIDATLAKPLEAPPPVATSGMQTGAAPPDALDDTPGKPVGAPLPTATPGTQTGGSPPDAPDATPIGEPPLSALAATPGTPIEEPPPNAPAAKKGKSIEAPAPSAPDATPGTELGAPPPVAPAAKPGFPIGGPSTGVLAATSGTPIGLPPSSGPASTSSASMETPSADASAATPGTPLGAPPPISEASEPALGDKDLTSSSGRNQHVIASVESNLSTSLSDKIELDATLTDKPLAEVPSLTPKNEEESVRTTVPTSEPLA